MGTVEARTGGGFRHTWVSREDYHYSGHEFQQYCQRMGVDHHITTSEDAQANGFAEAFVKIMVQLVHMEVVER